MSPQPPPRPEPPPVLEEGIRRFEAGDPVGAHACFGEAYRRAAQAPRVLAWYGLTLVLVEKNSNLGVALCDRALRATHGPPAPELVLCQARAHLALGQRERAVRAVARGLATSPGDPALRAAQEALGRRARPVVPFLGRRSLLNRILGRFRHRWGGGAALPDVTAASLGRLPGAPPAPAPAALPAGPPPGGAGHG